MQGGPVFVWENSLPTLTATSGKRGFMIEDASIVLSDTVGRTNLRIDGYCATKSAAVALKPTTVDASPSQTTRLDGGQRAAEMTAAQDSQATSHQ